MNADDILQMILQKVETQDSGELIFVGDNLEAHIYFQDGRLAWASDSLRKSVFSRYIRVLARIDDEVWGHLLGECMNNRLPIGETLIAWQLATLEQVRASLRFQLNDVLGQLWERTAVKSLFLERRNQYRSYRKELTFEIHELVALQYWKAECAKLDLFTPTFAQIDVNSFIT